MPQLLTIVVIIVVVLIILGIIFLVVRSKRLTKPTKQITITRWTTSPTPNHPTPKIRYGYSFVKDTQESEILYTDYMTPNADYALLSVPIDDTKVATARKIYKQYQDEAQPSLIGTISDNVTIEFQDPCTDSNIQCPPLPSVPTPTEPLTITGWSRNLTPPMTITVRYGYSFVKNSQESSILYYFGDTKSGMYHKDEYVTYKTDLAQMIIPVDPTNTATGRKLYKQILGQTPTLLITIPNNTLTIYHESCPSENPVC